MKKNVRLVFLAIIPVFVGFFLKTKWDDYSNSTKFLDVRVEYQNLNKVLEHGTNIKFDSTSVKNLHKVDFGIYNFNKQDIEDLSFYLELYGKKDGKAVVYSSEAWGRDFNMELVKKINSLSPSLEQCGTKFGYTLSNAKTGDLNKPSFYATFLIDAKDISDYKLIIDKAGYEHREYNFNNYYKSPQYPKGFLDHWWTLPLVILMTVVFMMPVAALINRFYHSPRIRKKLKEVIPEFVQKSSKLKKTEDYIDLYEEITNTYEWKNKSAFANFILGNKKPTKKD